MLLKQSIGEYQTLKVIQTFQCVQVYQAKNHNDGQMYTLKITDSQYSSLCQHEKDILTKLDSPRIIKFIDSKLDQQQYSLTILEYCDCTLEDFWNQSNQKFSEALALDIFKEILEGLEILEQQNIVHADICMKNIYIKQHHRKIANFEYAHLDKMFLIKSQQNCCNAPELYTPANLTSKADIFSLGCILFAMIFGYFPFNNENCNDYLVQIQRSQIFKNDQNTQSISPFVVQLIQRMVQYNPIQRPEIQEIKQILEANMNIEQPQNPSFKTETPQNNPQLWGMNQNIIFETQDFTPEKVESTSKNILFYFEVAEKFGGREFYNWKKTMYPRFMMYKKSYSELLNFTKEAKANGKIQDLKFQLENNDKTIIKLKFILDQMLLLLKQQNQYNYSIINWEKELNTDITPSFNSNFQKALQFLIEYFRVSQIPFSKKQNQVQNLKEMLILYINVQTCLTYKSDHANLHNQTKELQNLSQQTIEFLFKMAGYEQ